MKHSVLKHLKDLIEFRYRTFSVLPFIQVLLPFSESNSKEMKSFFIGGDTSFLMNISIRSFLIQTMEKEIESPLGQCLSPLIQSMSKIDPSTDNYFQIIYNLKINKYSNQNEWYHALQLSSQSFLKFCGADSENGLAFQTLMQLIRDDLSELYIIASERHYTQHQKEEFFHHFQGAIVNAPNNKNNFIREKITSTLQNTN